MQTLRANICKKYAQNLIFFSAALFTNDVSITWG